jgi:branched-chain amino acid transport system permease protein
MDYLFHLLVLVVIFGLLSASLELVAGRIGLLSLCHAAFFGTGAYTAGILAVRWHWGFWAASVAAVFIVAILSLLVSLPSLRLKGDYFAIATFGIQNVLWQVFNNWTDVTGGPMGITNIPSPHVLGWSANSPARFLLLAAIVTGVVWSVIYFVIHSPFGRVLMALRENDCLIQSFGKNPVTFKVRAFAISAGIAGLAGSLYGHYTSYIDPGSFTLSESILVLAMVVIGGAGNLAGPWIGAIVLVALPELLRFIGLPGAVAANLRLIIYGVLLVIIMMCRPRGLVGRYGFKK